jgi:iron complex transport system ATP-binding protein
MAGELISVEAVTYSYAGNGWQLHPSTFSVARGDILGIIGPNGSGKSTLLKLAAGVLQAPSGRVLLAGKDMRQLKRRQIARTLAYLPQHASSHFDYSVEEVVAMGRFPYLKGAGFMSAHDLEVISQSLEQAELDRFRQRRLSKLSGGERQRALLASVISQEPQVLLLDEPTTALDIHHQMKVFAILVALAKKGTSIVVVTHDLNLASVFCKQVLLLNQGAITCHGRPGDILQKEILETVYGKGLEIMKHPATGRPVIVPGADGAFDQKETV